MRPYIKKMKISHCNLLLTFVIYLNSLQSSNQQPRHNPQQPETPRESPLNNTGIILYINGIACGLSRGGKMYHLTAADVRTVHFNDDDLIYRNGIPIGIAQDQVFYERLSNRHHSHTRRLAHEDGDLVLRSGAPIAIYEHASRSPPAENSCTGTSQDSVYIPVHEPVQVILTVPVQEFGEGNCTYPAKEPTPTKKPLNDPVWVFVQVPLRRRLRRTA
ncbi:uncharacterized protein LOC117178475 [Belonocnema kinseyi]|uniref:uncharacterized protein LOC117178475 n=1 Tax=Belonocnema kinseyi TaxID=2817044 RepID=UPI00143D0A59|nr:uncharacterized protein LOC117178475 [Belonocnema kinseyi]